MVRCKFVCTDSSEGRVALEAVTSGSSENDLFFSYTPSGSLVLQTVNEAAALFAVGGEYYLDLTPAALTEVEPAPDPPLDAELRDPLLHRLPLEPHEREVPVWRALLQE